ncbi:MAG: HlyD family efflux transporter periplasmic adaptor subunit [Pseudomonadota bacterium]
MSVSLRVAVALMILLPLAACDTNDTAIPSVVVKRENHQFFVRAQGEVIASESIPISLPGRVRMAFNISWLIPEYSEVKRGQVVARFDDEEILASRVDSELGVVKSDLQLENYRRTADIDRTRIDHDASRVDGEKAITEAFAGIDTQYFSRNELIDLLGDVDYLEVAEGYYDWQATTHAQRAAAEESLIKSGRVSFQNKLDKQNAALGLIELKSPADGTFVYARTPWGAKLSKGQRVFAGRPVGLLPVRGKVRARLFVPESDAVGLEARQSVTFRLDSVVARQFTAKVSSVSSIASPRRRDDPQKFFVVEAEIDDVDPDLMRVGSSLQAEILTHEIESALFLPEQAVFFDKDSAYVYVVKGGEAEFRQVQLGRRSPNLVEVVDGLAAGERVSVIAPEVSAG